MHDALNHRRSLPAAVAAVGLAMAVLVSSGLGLAASGSPPVAHDQTFTTGGEAIEITLYATDPDGDHLTFSVVDEPHNGTLSGTAPSFLYTPSPGFGGTDSFTWKANDGEADSNLATASIESTEAEPLIASSPETTATQVAFRSSSSASSKATLVTDLVIPTPAQVVAGDLMWMHLSVIRPQLSNVGLSDPVVPAGWILIKEIDAGNAVRSYLYRKIAGTEPTTGYVVGLGIPSQVAAGIGVFSGANPFLFATSEATAVAATSVTVPGVFGWTGGLVAGFFGTLGSPVRLPAQMLQRWSSSTTQTMPRLRSVSTGAEEAVNGPIPARTATSTNQILWTVLLISMHPSS